MKTLCRLLMLTMFLSVMTIGSVWADWQYTNGTVAEVGGSFDFAMTEWLFKSDEVLPDEVAMGQSHLDLLSGVLGENRNTNKNHSLNGKDSLENAVKKNGTLYWFQNVQGTNLKHVFTTEASKEVEFVMQYIPESGEIYLYTYHSDDLYHVGLNGTPIQVYLTILVEENDEWNDLGSMEGHSVVTMHPDEYNRRIIDPENFRPGAVPHPTY